MNQLSKVQTTVQLVSRLTLMGQSMTNVRAKTWAILFLMNGFSMAAPYSEDGTTYKVFTSRRVTNIKSICEDIKNLYCHLTPELNHSVFTSPLFSPSSTKMSIPTPPKHTPPPPLTYMYLTLAQLLMPWLYPCHKELPECQDVIITAGAMPTTDMMLQHLQTEELHTVISVQACQGRKTFIHVYTYVTVQVHGNALLQLLMAQG